MVNLATTNMKTVTSKQSSTSDAYENDLPVKKGGKMKFTKRKYNQRIYISFDLN